MENIGTYSDFERTIEDFDVIDRSSHVFRYPVNKKGRGSLEHHFDFDITEFASKLDPVIEYLEVANLALRETLNSFAIRAVIEDSTLVEVGENGVFTSLR